jgi:hypothetical protein
MIRIERDLRRLPHVAQVLRTRGSHYRLVLDNGQSTFTSSTPGDHRALKNIVSQVRRSLRTTNRRK